jgi:hypothetical protein
LQSHNLFTQYANHTGLAFIAENSAQNIHQVPRILVPSGADAFPDQMQELVRFSCLGFQDLDIFQFFKGYDVSKEKPMEQVVTHIHGGRHAYHLGRGQNLIRVVMRRTVSGLT